MKSDLKQTGNVPLNAPPPLEGWCTLIRKHPLITPEDGRATDEALGWQGFFLVLQKVKTF